MRKTKIICTLGPVTESEEAISQLIQAGANIFRLNMSHASHDWVSAVVPRIREAARKLDVFVAILMDTQGPAIRTGDLSTQLNLVPGDVIELTVRGEKSEELYSVDVNYDGLIDDIAVGDTVLVDNGVIHLRVLEKKFHRIRCEVLTPGVMGSRRHINLPGVKVNLPPLTPKDLADVAHGAKVGVDYVALSFCREPEDVVLLRAVLAEHGSKAHIVAKIEDQLAVRNLRGIIDKADAIMVARGDLGIECAMEDLPIIQRRIVKRCLRHGRPVIVATHMLESMISNPVPTRAEVTDVANAVFEEADAIMLSGETTVGKYPVSCVKVLDKVARRIETSGGAGYAQDAKFKNDRQRTVQSATVLAASLQNSKIVIFTRSGSTARYVAMQRPRKTQVYAFAPDEEICRRIVLYNGVLPIIMPFDPNPEVLVTNAVRRLTERGLIAPGDNLVIVSDHLAGEKRFDSIQVRPVV